MQHVARADEAQALQGAADDEQPTQKDNHRRRCDDRIYDREDPSDDQEYALDQIPECVAFDGLRMASRKASAAALKDIAMAFSYFGLATSLLVDGSHPEPTSCAGTRRQILPGGFRAWLDIAGDH